MKQKYIAFLDILGFKELIINNNHMDVVHLFDNFRVYCQMALAKNKGKVDDSGRPVFDVTGSKINSIIISDSLVFWTNDDTPENFLELIDIVQAFIEFCHNKSKIFLRGAIVHGDFYYDNSGTIKGEDTIVMHPIIVGKALVDAHLIEKEIDFAGCVIDKSAIDKIKSDDKSFRLIWPILTSSKKIIEYDVPFKKERKKEWTINWVLNFTEHGRSFERDFALWEKTISDIGVKNKIKNTEEFYSYVRKHLYGM